MVTKFALNRFVYNDKPRCILVTEEWPETFGGYVIEVDDAQAKILEEAVYRAFITGDEEKIKPVIGTLRGVKEFKKFRKDKVERWL